MANTAQLKKEYKEKIAPALQKQFNYTSAMPERYSPYTLSLTVLYSLLNLLS